MIKMTVLDKLSAYDVDTVLCSSAEEVICDDDILQKAYLPMVSGVPISRWLYVGEIAKGIVLPISDPQLNRVYRPFFSLDNSIRTVING